MNPFYILCSTKRKKGVVFQVLLNIGWFTWCQSRPDFLHVFFSFCKKKIKKRTRRFSKKIT